ncbi:MAG: small subunit ribosomal protein [Candidatus Sumerlaeota bacterium]|nr:small subunit ribosomal protein [Candidatus Sumerlaeota bacterium]
MSEAHHDADPLEDEFAALLEQHLPGTTPREAGELIDATVVQVLEDVVLVGYGAKAEAPIPLREFLDARGQVTVAPGDGVRLVLLGTNGDGSAKLSYTKARAAEAGKMLQEAAARKVPVRGTISRVIKGGVLVDVGMPAFMPASQVDVMRIADFEPLVGQDIEAYVLEYDEQKGRAVLSRRQLLAERRDKRQREFLDTVQPGATMTGVVKDVLNFGVFVSFDGAEGLIPRSELSYERVSDPLEIAKPGDTIEVKVLDVSAENGRLTLSRKRLNRDPWDMIDELYPVGTVVRGKVREVKDFGAFVQLQEGMTGLLHAGDISWDTERKSASEHFQIGDDVTCQVAAIDKERKRLSLSLKHLSRDPWLDLAAKYPVGARVKGTVSSLRDFGAFVRLDESAEGMLHISELSWTERVAHPKDMLTEGQEIEVVVLKLDPDKRRIALGLKQLEPSPIDKFRKEHPVGSVVTGTVTRLAPFGVFVEVAPGLEGMIHISELDQERVESPEKVVRVGEEVTVKVLKIETGKDRIALSRKAAIRQAERANIEQYINKGSENVTGGLFGNALRAAFEKTK